MTTGATLGANTNPKLGAMSIISSSIGGVGGAACAGVSRDHLALGANGTEKNVPTSKDDGSLLDVSENDQCARPDRPSPAPGDDLLRQG